ncbi:hypothetical protein DIPPA_35232 [Diplonema papillatum]|nr:hypothetical protein DIPPA_35232 [Diplonema papillatum]
MTGLNTVLSDIHVVFDDVEPVRMRGGDACGCDAERNWLVVGKDMILGESEARGELISGVSAREAPKKPVAYRAQDGDELCVLVCKRSVTVDGKRHPVSIAKALVPGDVKKGTDTVRYFFSPAPVRRVVALDPEEPERAKAGGRTPSFLRKLFLDSITYDIASPHAPAYITVPMPKLARLHKAGFVTPVWLEHADDTLCSGAAKSFAGHSFKPLFPMPLPFGATEPTAAAEGEEDHHHRHHHAKKAPPKLSGPTGPQSPTDPRPAEPAGRDAEGDGSGKKRSLLKRMRRWGGRSTGAAGGAAAATLGYANIPYAASAGFGTDFEAAPIGLDDSSPAPSAPGTPRSEASDATRTLTLRLLHDGVEKTVTADIPLSEDGAGYDSTPFAEAAFRAFGLAAPAPRPQAGCGDNPFDSVLAEALLQKAKQLTLGDLLSPGSSLSDHLLSPATPRAAPTGFGLDYRELKRRENGLFALKYRSFVVRVTLPLAGLRQGLGSGCSGSMYTYLSVDTLYTHREILEEAWGVFAAPFENRAGEGLASFEQSHPVARLFKSVTLSDLDVVGPELPDAWDGVQYVLAVKTTSASPYPVPRTPVISRRGSSPSGVSPRGPNGNLHALDRVKSPPLAPDSVRAGTSGAGDGARGKLVILCGDGLLTQTFLQPKHPLRHLQGALGIRSWDEIVVDSHNVDLADLNGGLEAFPSFFPFSRCPVVRAIILAPGDVPASDVTLVLKGVTQHSPRAEAHEVLLGLLRAEVTSRHPSASFEFFAVTVQNSAAPLAPSDPVLLMSTALNPVTLVVQPREYLPSVRDARSNDVA